MLTQESSSIGGSSVSDIHVHTNLSLNYSGGNFYMKSQLAQKFTLLVPHVILMGVNISDRVNKANPVVLRDKGMCTYP